jgi:hypothetical protein
MLKCPSFQFYAKTRKCKFGANHKFNHPMPSVIAKETIYTATIDAADDLVPAKTRASTGPTEAHNPKGLPIRPVCVYQLLFFFS